MRFLRAIFGFWDFQTRVADVEDRLKLVERQIRQCDLDVSDALEKMQRLSGRLAKRAARAEGGGLIPPDEPLGTRRDVLNAQILARRARISTAAPAGGPRTLAQEAGDGLVPER